MFTVKTSRDGDDDAPQVSIQFAAETQREMPISSTNAQSEAQVIDSHVTSGPHTNCFSSVEGSYVSLLADIATIERNDEFKTRQSTNISVSDALEYGDITYPHGRSLNTETIGAIIDSESNEMIDSSHLAAAYPNIAYVTDTGAVQITSSDSPNIQKFVLIQPLETGLIENQIQTGIIPDTVESRSVEHLPDTSVIHGTSVSEEIPNCYKTVLVSKSVENDEIQQHQGEIDAIQHSAETSLIHHSSETGLIQHSAETSLIQHSAETSLIQHSAETGLIQHSAETSLIQHSAETCLIENSPQTSLIKNSAETGLIHNSAEIGLSQHSVETGLNQHSAEMNIIHGKPKSSVLVTDAIQQSSESCFIQNDSGMNPIAINKELQDAVANISGSINQVSRTVLHGYTEGLKLIQTISNQDKSVAIRDEQLTSENIQIPSFASLNTTSPSQLHKMSADTITTSSTSLSSSSRLQKFNVNELKDMGVTEKDILKNYLDQTKKSRRRKPEDTGTVKVCSDEVNVDLMETFKPAADSEIEQKNQEASVLCVDTARSAENSDDAVCITTQPKTKTDEKVHTNIQPISRAKRKQKQSLESLSIEIGSAEKRTSKKIKKNEPQCSSSNEAPGITSKNAKKATKMTLTKNNDNVLPEPQSTNDHTINETKLVSKSKNKTSKNVKSKTVLKGKGKGKKVAVIEEKEIAKTDACTDDDAVAEEVGSDPEERFHGELYRQIHFKDKLIIKLAPIIRETVKTKNVMIEVEIADSLQVSGLERESTSNGTSRYWFTVNTLDDARSPQKKEQTKKTSGSEKKIKAELNEPTKMTNIKTKARNKKSNPKAETRLDKNKEIESMNEEVTAAVTNESDNETIENTDNLDAFMTSFDQKKVAGDSYIEQTVTNPDDIYLFDKEIKVEVNDKNTYTHDYPNIPVDNRNVWLMDNVPNLAETDASQPKFMEKMAPDDTVKIKKKAVPRKRESLVGMKRNYIVRVSFDGKREYVCPICGYASKYSQNAVTHVMEHSDVKNFVCEECGLRFKSKNRLKKHGIAHQTDRPFHCPMCEQKFKSKRLYSCPICGHETTNRQNMTVHTYQHTDERPFQCEVCGQTFKGPSNLNAHKRQHSQEMHYKCPMCDSQFRDRGTYKQHMQRHMGDKKHVCEHCGKSFVISSDLKKHIRVHTGEKPYECNLCGKLFSDGSGMVRHRNMHTPKFKFECGACEKQFTRRDLCTYHIKKAHPESEAGSVTIKKVSITEEDIISKNIKNIKNTKRKSKTAVDTAEAAVSDVDSKNNSNKISTQMPPKKTWQNFERLTEEASRRLQEHTMHSYHDNLQHQFGDYQRLAGTSSSPYGHVPLHAMQTIYGNTAPQQYFEESSTNRPNVTGYLPLVNSEGNRNQIWLPQEKLTIVENE